MDSLQKRCLKVIANPEILKNHKHHLCLLPITLKNELLNIVCKRGYIIDFSIFKQIINSKTTVIDLGECTVTDDLLASLSICKNLHKLDLSLRRKQNRCITTKVLNSLFLHIPYLKILEVPDCKKFDDETIKIICQNCKLLQLLFIPYSSVTDFSLYLLGKNLKHLSAVNISGTQVTDTGIQFLTSGSLSKTLQEINIAACQNLTSYSTSIIAQNCQNLTTFIFDWGHDENPDLIFDKNAKQVKQVFYTV